MEIIITNKKGNNATILNALKLTTDLSEIVAKYLFLKSE
jgi:hypothetical protein